jgi:hypothetical protein
MIFSGVSVRKHFFERRDLRPCEAVQWSIYGHKTHRSEKASR